MPLYRYRVSSSDGKISELLIEGDSQPDAARRLQRRGLLPLAFLGEGSSGTGTSGLPRWGRRFDLVEFTDRLVPLLDASIPLERALGIVGEGLEQRYAEEVVADLRRGLHEGRRFSDLIRDRQQLFPRFYASVVQAGEEAGALPQVMAELRRFLTERRELRAFILSASIYPLFVLVAGAVMLAVIVGIIVPRFATVLQAGSVDTSLATAALLWLAEWGHVLGVCLLAGLASAGIFAVSLRREGWTRALWDEWVLRLPLAGRMVLLGNLARMCRTMSILMRSGVHLLDTVGIAARVLQNRTLAQSMTGLGAELRQGERLSHGLANSRFIPPFVLRMLTVGEETGDVEGMLERVADRYEEDLRRLVRRCLALFEPVVILALGLVVGAVVLCMFIAIMEMQGGMGF